MRPPKSERIALLEKEIADHAAEGPPDFAVITDIVSEYLRPGEVFSDHALEQWALNAGMVWPRDEE